jgi:hypothetical protein
MRRSQTNYGTHLEKIHLLLTNAQWPLGLLHLMPKSLVESNRPVHRWLLRAVVLLKKPSVGKLTRLATFAKISG